MSANKARVPPDDWRRQGQEAYLAKVTWAYRRFTPYREGWEHDHCEFCSVKLSEAPEDVNFGYETQAGYYWVCAECFDDFRAEFSWRADPDRPASEERSASSTESPSAAASKAPI